MAARRNPPGSRAAPLSFRDRLPATGRACYKRVMTLPFAMGTITLPDWLPGWVPVALLVPIVLWFLFMLAMPFAVLGTRSRLEAIEAQLDDLHAELRNLAMQLGALAPPALDRTREERAGMRQATFQPEPRASRAEPRIGWSGASEARGDWPRATDD